MPSCPGLVSLLLVGVVLGAAPGRAALVGEIEAARDPAALDVLASRLGSGTREGASPRELADRAEAFGALVGRARSLDADEGVLDRLIGVSRLLRTRVGETRERLEDAAGEEETALESLLRSEDWSRLDYAEALLGYWTGWTLVERARGADPSERRRFLEAARTEFSRSSLELSLPRIATLSLLGLGIAKRGLGDEEGARRALERFEAQAAHEGETELLAPALFELAVLAFRQGDLERAGTLVARLPEAALGPEERLELVRLEAEARLARARPGDAERAAALLRILDDAGGPHARAALALALAHPEALAGQEVGPAGLLLRAEEAFDAGRIAEARDAYAAVLERASGLTGDDLDRVRYRYALSVHESGADPTPAVRALEALLAREGDRALRAPAARLLYRLASGEAGLRAARILLAEAPDAPEAAHARYRLARSGRRDAEALLDAIPPSSDAYPLARVERLRRHAEALQRLENEGRPPSPERARALAAELVEVRRLLARGRLSADPERDATLAVLVAKAEAWSGAAPAEVLAHVGEAEREPGLSEAGRRALLRLRLRALRQAGEFAALLSHAEEGAARDFALYREALAELEAQREPLPPPELVARLAATLAARAPAQEREALVLSEAEAWLRAGRGDLALERARAVVERDPDSGDARWLEARALARSGDAEAAARAWGELAARLEPASPRRLDADLSHAEALRAAGHPAAACHILGELAATSPEILPEQRRRLESLSSACP